MSSKEIPVGRICNYYGGLSIKAEGGKFWWSIENYSGMTWEEIPESLYQELLKFSQHKECEGE